MIDLHSHILPGLDDGARNLGEAVEMVRMAADSAISAIVTTPHCSDDRCGEIRAGLRILREAVKELELPVHLYAGMEIFGTWQTARLLSEGKLLTINGSRYPLVEFSFRTSGAQETRILEQILRAGFTPVVAHPERYEYIQYDPRLMNLWYQMGCRFQVNRGSLLGRFGEGPRRTALELVERGFAAAVATDAHSSRFRTPWMADIREFLRQEFSAEAAAWLLEENPRRILRNEQLPPAEPEWFR